MIGATGHVGSQVAIGLARAGCDVTALVRQPAATIQDPYEGEILYKQGDLYDEDSLRRAVKGVDVVISTANGVVPQRKGGDAGRVNRAALGLIRICEEAGVPVLTNKRIRGDQRRTADPSAPLRSGRDDKGKGGERGNGRC